MTAPGMIAVEATSPKYFGIKHMPGRLALDAAGKGVWPADQFTYRLIAEGALREIVDVPAERAAPAAARGTTATPTAANPLSHLKEIVAEAETEISHLEAGATVAPPA